MTYHFDGEGGGGTLLQTLQTHLVGLANEFSGNFQHLHGSISYEIVM